MADFAVPLSTAQAQGSQQTVSSPDNVGDAVLLAQHYGQVRNVIQIPFDSSIDATHPLECFFQMPPKTVRIAKALLWVQRRSFRQYSAALSSGGGITTSVANSGHSHTLGTYTGQATSTGLPDTHTHSGAVAADGSHNHPFNGPTATFNETVHTHNVDTTHNHTLTPGIFESASSANFSIDVADDGVTYSSFVGLSAPPLNKQDITAKLTTAAGDKRVRINADGLGFCQVLLMLDLVVGVAPGPS